MNKRLGFKTFLHYSNKCLWLILAYNKYILYQHKRMAFLTSLLNQSRTTSIYKDLEDNTGKYELQALPDDKKSLYLITPKITSNQKQ